MLEFSQIAALVIFVAMFIAIVAGKVHRFIPAIIGAALTIVVVFLITLLPCKAQTQSPMF